MLSTGTYSRWTGCVFVFNLIVGTEVLALPKAFEQVGLVLSTVILSILCLFSYITSTYVIEAMSIANGMQKLNKLKKNLLKTEIRESSFNIESVTMPEIVYDNYAIEIDEVPNYAAPPQELPNLADQFDDIIIEEAKDIKIDESYFEITNVFEMGQMAFKFFNRFGLVLFHLFMCIYLYGNLAISAVAVAQTLRNVACTFQLDSKELNSSTETFIHKDLEDSDLCWMNSGISRMNGYRIILASFFVIFCSFVFFKFTKTKFIQFASLIMKWLAFGIMFALIGIYLAAGNRNPAIKMADFYQSANYLGMFVHVFMCQHSLPSLVTLSKRKNNIFTLFSFNFIVILVLYLTLSIISSFTFKHVGSPISLNFQTGFNLHQVSVTNIAFFQYFLSLFPVFVVCASFPILGITLKNNLRKLFMIGNGKIKNIWFMNEVFYPLLATLPPIAAAFFYNHITFIVEFTGPYAAIAIQYVIPICLVHYARKDLEFFMKDFKEYIPKHVNISDLQIIQPHQSPFKHKFWAILILLCSAILVILITMNIIMNQLNIHFH